MMRRLLGILFVFMAYGKVSFAETKIEVTGDITPCRLEDAIEKIQFVYQEGKREFTLELNSRGGDVGAAIAFIENILQLDEAKFSASVTGLESQCSSACFPIFSAVHSRKASRSAKFYIHGLSWQSSDLLFFTLTQIPALEWLKGLTRPSRDCKLGANKYRAVNGGPDIERAAADYLAAVSLGSPKIAKEISKYVTGSKYDEETFEPKDFRRIDPEFLRAK